MKKAIIAVALLMTVAGIAQKNDRGHGGSKSDLTAEQVATLKTKKMTLALDLSEAQQVQINALNLENAKVHKEKMKEREARKAQGERKKLSAEERFAMQNERLDAKIAHKAKIKKILSQEQYAKWEKLAHHKGHRGHRKGKNGEGRSKHKKEGRK